MTVGELNRALNEHKVPGLLLLYGEETFSLEEALGRVRDATVPPAERDFNLTSFDGREATAGALLDEVRTLPVFARQRLVIVRGAQHLKAAELDALLPYLKDPVPETVLVLVADKIDGRRKFYQEFRKRGALVEFKKLYDNQIPAFVKEQARQAGRSLTEEAMALFCRRVGTNLQEVHGELSKLFQYMGEKTLAEEGDVAAIVSDTRADSIFDLTNALGRRKLGEATRLLRRLLEEGVAPLVVLSMLVRHFRQLWKTRSLQDQGVPFKELSRRIGVNPYFMKDIAEQASRFNAAQYREAFNLFLETDLALKSSGGSPGALLDRLLYGLVGQGGGR
ncbi:MAG: DNA polymerase III subunit delta [Desulfuromonas sp.]|uniref:DNA polymerase III subunit delta n=1 Tax=Desulfuromonas sp. TaxID=892 RepID=UPI000CBC9E75|nr:DNA polymerase III subunit delta [Desulfuromonas sp.]PLX82565.1 MAG: DNA polymerase III subunit delta [Desulfuromonas sp.]